MTLAAVTLGHSLLKAGLILDVLLAAEALCSIGRARRVAVAGALVLSPLLLAAALWKSTPVSGVLAFWLAYIMTRPLGASTGDWLSSRCWRSPRWPACSGRGRACSRCAPCSRCRFASR